MRNLLFPIVLLSFCFSCTENDTIKSSNSKKQQPDTLKREEINLSSFKLQDSSLSLQPPDILQLPFGPPLKKGEDLLNKKGTDFYANLIGKDLYNKPIFTPTYLLPPVEKVDYIPIGYEDSVCRDSNIPIDSLLLVNKYKCRLPNLYNWEVYYMSNEINNGKDFPPVFAKYCEDHFYNFSGYYGHLIFYDRPTKFAKVLSIYFNYYVDALNVREFYIDKQYAIFVGEQMFTDGDGEKAERNDGPLYKIKMRENGSLEIKILND